MVCIIKLDRGMETEKVYFVESSEDYDDQHYGFAFSDEDLSPADIQNWKQDIAWKELKMELKEGEFADYLVNDLNIPLCSKRLKDLIVKHADNSDDFTWYPIIIQSASSWDQERYYYLKTNILLDNVIDLEKSDIEKGIVYVPYFIKEKTRDIFRCAYDKSYLFVSQALKDVITNNNITGISFETWE